MKRLWVGYPDVSCNVANKRHAHTGALTIRRWLTFVIVVVGMSIVQPKGTSRNHMLCVFPSPLSYLIHTIVATWSTYMVNLVGILHSSVL